MKCKNAVVFLALLTCSTEGLAQSVFDGTWRPDPEVYSPTRKPDVVELAGGYFECRSCTPPYRIKADGLDQPISGNPYYDTLSVVSVDDRKVKKTAKRGSQTVVESEITVSVDGRTETERETLYFMAPKPVEMTIHSSRVSAGPHGSHSISGAWRATDGEVSNHVEDTVFHIVGNTLEMSDRMGRSFSAKLDGTEAPYNGSDEFTAVSLKNIDDHTIEESDKKDGKVIKISRWSVAPDGETIHVRFDDTHGHVQEQDGRKVE